MSFHDHGPPLLAEETAHVRALLSLPGARRLLSDRAELYIRLLDLLDADPDLEPNDHDAELTAAETHGRGFNSSPTTPDDSEDGGDAEPDSDGEPHEDHEPDSDGERSLGWQNSGSQSVLHTACDEQDCELDTDSEEGEQDGSAADNGLGDRDGAAEQFAGFITPHMVGGAEVIEADGTPDDFTVGSFPYVWARSRRPLHPSSGRQVLR